MTFVAENSSAKADAHFPASTIVRLSKIAKLSKGPARLVLRITYSAKPPRNESSRSGSSRFSCVPPNR